MVKEPKPFLLLGLCHRNFLFVNLSLTEHEQEPIVNKIKKKRVLVLRFQDSYALIVDVYLYNEILFCWA